MKRSDVAVTGIGLVTPLGLTARDSVRAWESGCAAPKREVKELGGTSLAGAEVGALPEMDAAARLGERRMLKYMSDAAVIGCIAAREATTDANVRRRFAPERVGLYAGTGLAGAGVKESDSMIRESIGEDGAFSCRLLGSRGLPKTNPLLSFKILANMPACIVSILESVKGPNLLFTPWEGQTGAALAEAWEAVALGEVDCALAGAADYPCHPATYVFLRQRGFLRDGEYPSPAAAYLVLERAERAARDGQRVHAEIGEMEAADCGGSSFDPLAPRMGRSFAAAPAVLTALACLTDVAAPASVCGADGLGFRAVVRRLP